MRFAPTLTLLSAFALAASAEAATVSFALTDTNTQDTFTFSLDPAVYTDLLGDFLFHPVVLVDGYPETLAAEFRTDNSTYEDLYLTGTQFNQTFIFNPSNGALPLTGNTSTGLPATVTAGTYAGTVPCYASATMPHLGQAQLPTLALLQAPIIILGCDDDLTLTVTTPSATSTTLTPEPSTLALLGSGALGVFGIARRRFLC